MIADIVCVGGKLTKNDKVNMAHHLIALCLVVSSYIMRHYNYGLIVADLHYLTDVFLEYSRLTAYLFGGAAGLYTFILFTVCFAYCRVIQFPVYLILPMFNGIGEKCIQQLHPGFNGYETFIWHIVYYLVMLGLLYGFDLIWMHDILVKLL